MKIKQMLTLPILVFTILTTGCAVTQKPPEYVSEMSEAKYSLCRWFNIRYR